MEPMISDGQQRLDREADTATGLSVASGKTFGKRARKKSDADAVFGCRGAEAEQDRNLDRKTRYEIQHVGLPQIQTRQTIVGPLPDFQNENERETKHWTNIAQLVAAAHCLSQWTCSYHASSSSPTMDSPGFDSL